MRFLSSTSSSNASLVNEFISLSHRVVFFLGCVLFVFHVFTLSKKLWHQPPGSPWTTSALGPVYSSGGHSLLVPPTKRFPVSESGETSEVKIYKHIPESEPFSVKKAIRTTAMVLNLSQIILPMNYSIPC